MTDAFAFTPDADFVDRRLRTMLAALDDALAGISDAREELHTLYAGPDADTGGVVAAHDEALSTHLYLAHAESDLRAAAAILRQHRQLTSPRP
ncbi:hypothetical protein [Rhodococcus qingshengii]|uniref:hypothetical protein n=1 Tax=Rhodococcus qingshengii TaxID=334542 RepID=UPI0030D40D20